MKLKNYISKTFAEELDQLNTNNDMEKEGIQHKIKMRMVLKNLKSKIMDGKCAGRINRKIISKEGAFLWWFEERPESRK